MDLSHSQFPSEGYPLPDKADTNSTAKVYGMVENIDDNVGRLLRELDRLNLDENTIVVFLTDNGPQQERFNAGLRGQKSSTYEGGIRVPSFWQWQGKINAPAKIDRIAAHIDIAPTLLDLAGVPGPEGLAFDGRSLVPLLRGDAASWPDRTLFFQCHRGLAPQRYQNAAVETDRYKLVLGPASFNDENWKPADPPVVELYDLPNDPAEEHNLATEQPDLASDLQKRYEAWFDDVRSTRQFTPGVIHLGSDQERITILCRYQDATWVDGKPTTWTVEIERAGEYELTVSRGDDSGPAEMFVSVNGEVASKPADRGNRAVFDLPAGPAKLDMWVKPKGGPRTLITDNSPVGDVAVRKLP
jgi:arylsulfatase A-like enzyme